jgi:hypothetical protein
MPVANLNSTFMGMIMPAYRFLRWRCLKSIPATSIRMKPTRKENLMSFRKITRNTGEATTGSRSGKKNHGRRRIFLAVNNGKTLSRRGKSGRLRKSPRVYIRLVRSRMPTSAHA